MASTPAAATSGLDGWTEEDAIPQLASQTKTPAVVWLRVGNCSNRASIVWFAPLLPNIVEALERGERLVEVV